MIDKNIFLTIVCSTLIILLLIALLLIVFFISGKRRLSQEMELTQTRLSFERELRQVENEVAEEIMGHFARELHDNIGQLLMAAHIQVENQKLDYPELIHSFRSTEIYLSEATSQLRLLSRTLNNDYIGHIGLLAAIQLEVDRLNALKRLRIHWQGVAGESNLRKNQELMLFRIFQEITQNALRHSAAANLNVKISNLNGNFELQVQDDGKGFDVEKTLQQPKASGIKNILKRALLADLKLTIDSAEGKGCLIIVKNMPS